MDGDSNPTEIGAEGGREGFEKEKPLGAAFLRCAFTVIFSLTASFLFSFLFGLLAIALGTLSNSSAMLLPANCRILSGDVDLRWSRHCGLSLSNYKHKNVLYRLEKARVQCHDEYYWASVFKVEYKDFFSGRNVTAIAEAPREALPGYCRPNFNDVWLIKSKFKVNDTYKCRYAPGTHRADVYSDEFFNCGASEPSNLEKAKKSLFLLLRYTTSFSSNKVKSGHRLLGTIVGVMTGMFVAICSSIAMRVVYMLKSSISRRLMSREHLVYFAIHLRRGCLVVAYISAMGWLTIQYSKVIGLKHLLFSSDFRERLSAR